MSSPLSYVEIPAYARQLEDSDSPSGSPIIEAEQPRKLPRIMTSFPHSDALSAATASPRMSEAPLSPKQSTFNIPALLLSSALPSGPVQSDPKHTAGQGKLLSSKDPLSIPITTTNFRRFVGKIGPVFWFQDRVEEIITWKKGWKVTCVWMAAYAFLCECSAQYRMHRSADLRVRRLFPRSCTRSTQRAAHIYSARHLPLSQ
jgi:hypothetical protein